MHQTVSVLAHMTQDMQPMTRLRLPRNVFRQARGQTKEDQYEATRIINADSEEVTLDGLSLTVPATTVSTEVGCLYSIMNIWNWRSRAKQRRDKHSRDQIVKNIESISEKINTHDARLVELEQEIKECLKTKEKPRARRLLLQKKRTTNTIQSLNMYRDDLENVLISLEESNEQQALVASFQTASRVLKIHTGAKGSGVDNYDDLADELQEAQQDVNELQQAVSSRIVDDPDIEEELNAMFVDTRTSHGQSDNPPPSAPITLPEVPTTLLKQVSTSNATDEQFVGLQVAWP